MILIDQIKHLKGKFSSGRFGLINTLGGRMTIIMNIEAERSFMKKHAFGLKKIRSEMVVL